MSGFPGIEYLSALPMWKGDGNFNLENISKVLTVLGSPQDQVACVHVAGTNGKGSTSAAIASILAAAGFRVGLTISPHLVQQNERIIINGLPIDNQGLSEVALEVRRASENAQVSLSYHEAITACAFQAFAERKLDWAVIEVGLGGRLDASNCIKQPEVAVITNIDFDHEQILGNSLASIAKEKAGIIKPGCKVVVGPLETSAYEEIASAAIAMKAELYYYGREFKTKLLQEGARSDLCAAEFTSSQLGKLTYLPSLRGQHQVRNMAVAIAAGRLCGIGLDQCKHGVESVFWPGRLETVGYRGKKVLIDCAHNPGGIRELVSYIKQNDFSNVAIGFGVLTTKNWQSMIEDLREVVDDWSLLTPDSQSALAPADVERYLSGIGINSRRFDSNYANYLSFISNLDSSWTVIIAGSMYMLGTLRPLLGMPTTPIWKSSHPSPVNCNV